MPDILGCLLGDLDGDIAAGTRRAVVEEVDREARCATEVRLAKAAAVGKSHDGVAPVRVGQGQSVGEFLRDEDVADADGEGLQRGNVRDEVEGGAVHGELGGTGEAFP